MGTYRELESLIEQAENIVFFGGAGVSTESGIPDFRGSGGLYTYESDAGYTPEEILHRDFFLHHPRIFYDYYRTHMLYPDAEPNSAHWALARLEAAGKLSAVITQNIDGLHQRAGSKNVIELHGSTLKNYCMRCGKPYGMERILQSPDLPTCPACGGLVRPDVVLYGEGLPSDSWSRAEEAIYNADLLIVGGTSLTVHPAAGLIGNFVGGHLVIINRTPTPYDGYAELLLDDLIGEVFEELDERVFG